MSYSVLASAVNHPDSAGPFVGTFNHRIIQSLHDDGNTVDVISPRPYAPPVGPYAEYADLPRTEEWGSYVVHHPRFCYLRPKRLFYGLAGDSFRKRVRPYVERTFTTPDVVHACHIYLDGYGMVPYARDHEIPLFTVSHGYFMNNYDDLTNGVRERVDETLAAATKVLCVSNALADSVASHVPHSKVAVVPIGADPDEYPVERAAALRESFGIEPGTTVVLFVGEFCERKGIPDLLSVLADESFPGTEFVFVGHGGAMERDLRQAVGERGDGGRVYTGLDSERLREWFAVADLLVLPSRAEGRPTVIYEAMAAETAVLGTTVGGIPEQVVDGETGTLVPPRDADALREALYDLVTDGDRLEEMGRAGLDRLVSEDWTWNGHARRVRGLYDEALR